MTGIRAADGPIIDDDISNDYRNNDHSGHEDNDDDFHSVSFNFLFSDLPWQFCTHCFIEVNSLISCVASITTE